MIKELLGNGWKRWKLNSCLETTEDWGDCQSEFLPPYELHIMTQCFSTEEEREQFVESFEAICDGFTIEFNGGGKFEYNCDQPTTLFEWVEACTGAKPPLLESECVDPDDAHKIWWLVHQKFYEHFDHGFQCEFKGCTWEYKQNILKIGTVEFVVYPYEQLNLIFLVNKAGSQKQLDYLFNNILNGSY
jgi:hypothetical protein